MRCLLTANYAECVASSAVNFPSLVDRFQRKRAGSIEFPNVLFEAFFALYELIVFKKGFLFLKDKM